MKKNQIDALIKEMSLATDALDDLTDSYTRLPAVMDAETNAIGSAHIEALEKARDQKATVVSAIETASLKLRELGSTFARWADHFAIPIQSRKMTITEIAGLLLAISEHTFVPADKAPFVKHLAKQFATKAQFLVTQRAQIQPLIEKNQYLVQRALSRNIESMRFWQEVAQEFLAGYNASGVQRSKNKVSMLNVKA